MGWWNGGEESAESCGRHVTEVTPNASRTAPMTVVSTLGRLIPGGVEAVVIGTRPETADETMQECADLGIKYVWMHRSMGGGSVSKSAATYGRERGIAVIDGGCPSMFDPTADGAHKAMRFILTISGAVPRRV